MHYPTPHNLPPPEEVQRSLEEDEFEHARIPSAQFTQEDTAATAAAVTAFIGTYMGLQILTLEKQDAYRDYHNTFGALTRENEQLYERIGTMPANTRVTRDGKEVSSRIDAINTQIAATKYEYEGGIHPATMTTTSTLLGVIAAGAAVISYIGTSPARQKTTPKL